MMKEDFGDVYFGTEKANDVDWRDYDPEEVDDEELAETPGDVVGMLGFDPREFFAKRIGLATVIKHLPGQHDQQSHAGTNRGVMDQVDYKEIESISEKVWKGEI